MSEGKKGLPLWAWLLILGPILVFVVGIGAALAIYGVRKYVANAKQAEADAALVSWSAGIVRCAERDGHLPPSAVPVPASLSALAGHKYQSAPAEWSAPAHTCAAFSMSTPQYYQYSWSVITPEAGLLEAVADFNGDGAPDSQLQLAVSCSGGKCSAGAPMVTGGSGGPGPSRAGVGSPSAPRREESLTYQLLMGLGGLALLGSGLWLVITAFKVSVGWGLITWLVPCGAVAFIVKYWQVARGPFAAQLVAIGYCVVAGIGLDALGLRYNAAAPATTEPALPVSTAGVVSLPPLPSAGPLPAFDGSAVDVSSVMGRARKLANAWEPDAALLSVEATVQSGKIQPQLGGTAKLSFGPSPFGNSGGVKHTGLFVVTYDQSGIHGAPEAGKAGTSLPEPMCSPEAVLLRAAELGTAPLLLRYGLDSVERPSWIVHPVSEPKQLRIFEPDQCAPRGTIVVRPRR